ncbi:hypothetical protein [Moorena producens]|uniref:hypothetical protein n=1 Tax=Moorena producens TaxID=1155739 RepID=UPI003C7409F9
MLSKNWCSNCYNSCSRFPTPDSLLPTPYSLFPIPYSLFPLDNDTDRTPNYFQPLSRARKD